MNNVKKAGKKTYKTNKIRNIINYTFFTTLGISLIVLPFLVKGFASNQNTITMQQKKDDNAGLDRDNKNLSQRFINFFASTNTFKNEVFLETQAKISEEFEKFTNDEIDSLILLTNLVKILNNEEFNNSFDSSYMEKLSEAGFKINFDLSKNLKLIPNKDFKIDSGIQYAVSLNRFTVKINSQDVFIANNPSFIVAGDSIEHNILSRFKNSYSSSNLNRHYVQVAALMLDQPIVTLNKEYSLSEFYNAMNSIVYNEIFDQQIISQNEMLGNTNLVKVYFTKFEISENKDSINIVWNFRRLDKDARNYTNGAINEASVLFLSAVAKLQDVIKNNLLEYSRLYNTNISIFRVDSLHAKISQYFTRAITNRRLNVIENGEINKTMQFFLSEFINKNSLSNRELQFIKQQVKDYTFEIFVDNEDSISVFKKPFVKTQFDLLPLYSPSNYERLNIRSVIFYDSRGRMTNEIWPLRTPFEFRYRLESKASIRNLVKPILQITSDVDSKKNEIISNLQNIFIGQEEFTKGSNLYLFEAQDSSIESKLPMYNPNSEGVIGLRQSKSNDDYGIGISFVNPIISSSDVSNVEILKTKISESKVFELQKGFTREDTRIDPATRNILWFSTFTSLSDTDSNDISRQLYFLSYIIGTNELRVSHPIGLGDSISIFLLKSFTIFQRY